MVRNYLNQLDDISGSIDSVKNAKFERIIERKIFFDKAFEVNNHSLYYLNTMVVEEQGSPYLTYKLDHRGKKTKV